MEKSINLFVGGLDLDSDPLEVEKGDYIDAVNIQNGNTELNTAGSVGNKAGNLLVNNPFLKGNLSIEDNSCIGWEEDLKDNTGVSFICNAQGYHGIFRWYANKGNAALGTIEKIMQVKWPNNYTPENPNPLNFSKEQKYLITGINLVDGILSWTDNHVSSRSINIIKANETGKKRKFRIYFNKDNFASQRVYRIRVFAQSTPVPLDTLAFYTDTGTYLSTTSSFMDAWSASVNSALYYRAESCGDFAEVEMTSNGEYFMSIDEVDYDPANPGEPLLNRKPSVIVPYNFYPDKDYGIEAVIPGDILTIASAAPMVGNPLVTILRLTGIVYIPFTAGQTITVNAPPYVGTYTFLISGVPSPSNPLSVIVINTPFIGSNPVPGTIQVTATQSTQTYDLLSDDLIDEVKYDPKFPPLVAYRSDTSRKTNLVINKIFYFRIKYIYYDYENTVLSAYSTVPIQKSDASANILTTIENYIEVDFNDPRLLNPALVSVIRNVEVCFSNDDKATWKKARTLEPYEFAGGQLYKFYNDGSSQVIDKAEAALPFHAIPILYKSKELVDDRSFMGDLTEGYDKPCVDASLETTYTNNVTPDTYTIRGVVVFRNGAGLGDDYQPVWTYPGASSSGFGCWFRNPLLSVFADYAPRLQFIPLNGITAYLAGTPYYGVSKQNPLNIAEQDPSTGVINVNTLGNIPVGSNYWKILTGTIPGVINSDAPFAALGYGTTGGIPVTTGTPLTQCFSTFEITGVPNGRYKLRLASNLIQAADINDPSLSYQRTSTYAISVGGSADHEIEVFVNGADVVINYSQVEDMFRTTAPVVFGYVIDHDTALSTPPTLAEMLGETRIDLCRVHFTGSPSVLYTDHNGFIYGAPTAGDIDTIQSGAFNVAPTKYDATGAAWTPPAVGAAKQGFFRNLDDDLSNFSRTVLEGYVYDAADGITSVAGVVVVCSRGGWSISSSLGYYRIVIYVDTPDYDISSIARRGGKTTYTSASPLVTMSFAFDQLLFGNIIINASANGTTIFDYAFPFTLTPNLVTILNQILSASNFKRGFTGEIGVVYFDDADRFCAVCTSDALKLNVPFYTETAGGIIPPTGYPIVTMSIFNDPPDWAVKYHIVRTKNLQVTRYLQWVSNAVTYIDAAGAPASFNSGTAVMAKINLDNIGYYIDNLHPNATINFTFTKGDRLRFIKNNSGNFLTQYYDYEVVKVDVNDVYIYYDNAFDITGGLSTGVPIAVLFEIYTPGTNTAVNVFYEFGECYDIATAIFHGIRRRYHTGNIQNQSFGPLPLATITPAKVQLGTGDVFYRLKNIPLHVTGVAPNQLSSGNSPNQIDDQSVSDFYKSLTDNTGRPHTDAIDIGRIHRPSSVRFSDRYIAGSKINGLCAAQPLNEKQFSTDYGSIQKFELANTEVLKAYFSNSIQVSMYINKGILREATGQAVVAISEDVIPRSNEMQRYVGTQNPESVAMNDMADVFALDNSMGIVSRNSGNGIIDVSAIRASKFFSNQSQLRYVSGRAPAVFDLFNNEYILTLGALEYSAGEAPECEICLPDCDPDEFGDGLVMRGTVIPNNLLLFSLDVNSSGYPLTSLMIANYININTATTNYTATINLDGCVVIKAPLDVALYGGRGILIEIFTPLGIKTYNFKFTDGIAPDNVTAEYVPQTIVFNPSTVENDKISKNRWVTRYMFTPEYYGRVRQQIVSFKNGQMYLHGVGLQNNFYGVQYSSTIDFCMNDNFSEVKNFKSLEHKATSKWYVPKDGARIPVSAMFPQGMLSEIPLNIIELIEGKYYAEFLQDSLTPGFNSFPTQPENYTDALLNGRDLLGNVLIIKLQNDDVTKTLLYFAGINYFKSFNS